MASLQLINGPAQDGAADHQMALAERLLQVLDEEFTALESNDAPALVAIAEDKARLLKAIDPYAPARLSGSARQRFEALLRDGRERNKRNGEYVAAQHAYVRARWAGLSAVAGQSSFYNAEGVSRFGSRFGSALGQA
jgi:flagellar biosynthesis/type III secretory pathway chaperone